MYLNQVPVAQIDNDGEHYAYGLITANPDAYPGKHERIVYLHTDYLGTPRVATNSKQAVVWRWEGGAFGDSKPLTGEALREGARKLDENAANDGGGKVTINLRFRGQYYDRETDLFYNWHRYYDPQVGRYMTSDAIGLAGGLNTFSYARANALRWTDFLGLDTCYWEQDTGDYVCVSSDGQVIAQSFDQPGYSGFGSGLNNPAMEDVPNIGPTPAGDWQVVGDLQTFQGRNGPVTNALPIVPMPGNDVFNTNRDPLSFYIHGPASWDSPTSSEGCPIMPLNDRKQIKFGTTIRVY